MRKNVVEGSTKCCFSPTHSWCLPKYEYLRLDTMYRKSKGGNYFLRFRCNDTDCTAYMDILMQDVELALGITK